LSVGHRRGEKKSFEDLYKFLGTGDTPKLYAAPVKLDTSHDVPYAGGNSADRKTVYIDRRLHAEVMSGKVWVRGMSKDNIVQAWLEHEHAEKAIDDGDNPVDVYEGAHGFATAKEEKFIEQLGIDPDKYEAAIAPALKRCLNRSFDNPPRDLWCGPYLDHPTPRDAEILRVFRKCGVEDAFKMSKVDAEYGIGQDECKTCKHYGGGQLNTCAIVSGIVRHDRQCDYYEEK
jgi:hypothetical protein